MPPTSCLCVNLHRPRSAARLCTSAAHPNLSVRGNASPKRRGKSLSLFDCQMPRSCCIASACQYRDSLKLLLFYTFLSGSESWRSSSSRCKTLGLRPSRHPKTFRSGLLWPPPCRHVVFWLASGGYFGPFHCSMATILVAFRVRFWRTRAWCLLACFRVLML